MKGEHLDNCCMLHTLSQYGDHPVYSIEIYEWVLCT